jgi:hypothetical protein
VKENELIFMNGESSPPDMTSGTFNPEPSNYHTKDSIRPDTIITGTINSDTSSTDTNNPTTTDYYNSRGNSTGGSSYVTTDSSGSIDNGNSDPNFSAGINDGTASSSELASSIKNKVDSMIRNSISGIINKTPFLLPFH